MDRSTTIKLLCMGALLILVLPLFAFPLFATGTVRIGGGCHGHHPAPMSSHSCCYARPQTPAQVQVVPTKSPLQMVGGLVVPCDVQEADTGLVTPRDAELSPPPQFT